MSLGCLTEERRDRDGHPPDALRASRSLAQNTVVLPGNSQHPPPKLSPRLGLSVILLSMIFKSSPLFRQYKVLIIDPTQGNPSPHRHYRNPDVLTTAQCRRPGHQEGLSFSAPGAGRLADGHWPRARRPKAILPRGSPSEGTGGGHGSKQGLTPPGREVCRVCRLTHPHPPWTHVMGSMGNTDSS